MFPFGPTGGFRAHGSSGYSSSSSVFVGIYMCDRCSPNFGAPFIPLPSSRLSVPTIIIVSSVRGVRSAGVCNAPAFRWLYSVSCVR